MTTVSLGTSWMTMELAPMRTLSPMVIVPMTRLPTPMKTLSPTVGPTRPSHG